MIEKLPNHLLIIVCFSKLCYQMFDLFFILLVDYPEKWLLPLAFYMNYCTFKVTLRVHSLDLIKRIN